MPNGGYEPVPIREHDAAIEETKRRIAARSALMAISSSADLLGISFEQMVGVMNDARQVDRIMDALGGPRPEPQNVPVTVHDKERRIYVCLNCGHANSDWWRNRDNACEVCEGETEYFVPLTALTQERCKEHKLGLAEIDALLWVTDTRFQRQDPNVAEARSKLAAQRSALSTQPTSPNTPETE